MGSCWKGVEGPPILTRVRDADDGDRSDEEKLAEHVGVVVVVVVAWYSGVEWGVAPESWVAADVQVGEW